MKPSTLIGICLTLFMLLLVLSAGFLFLFQGRQALQVQYQTELDDLGQKQAEAELRLNTAEGTRAAAEKGLEEKTAVVATTQQDMLKLVQESVQSQQTVEALQAEATRLSTALTEANSTRTAPQQNPTTPDQPAVIEILAPSGKLTITQGQEVELIVAARDVQGITTIQIKLNGRVIDTVQGAGNTFVTHRISFPFLTSGPQTLEAVMTNSSAGVTMANPVQIEIAPPTE